MITTINTIQVLGLSALVLRTPVDAGSGVGIDRTHAGPYQG
ncbi:MAG: hypothetical protein AAFX79_09790 [Planctomycetota bacterium]